MRYYILPHFLFLTDLVPIFTYFCTTKTTNLYATLNNENSSKHETLYIFYRYKMTIKELIGVYNIIGTNQGNSNNTYKGILTLTLDTNNRIVAKWKIHTDQEQSGTGFFKDNILVINFQYLGEDSNIYKGVVVYNCITKDILDGFWSEEFGDPKHLGTEQCFRIKEEILN